MPDNPTGYNGSKSFQTKDLMNCLGIYEIRENGEFFARKTESKWIEGNPEAKSWLDKIGHLKEIKSWWEKESITETITMYDYQVTEGDYDYEIEYEVILVEGFVKNVKLSTFKAFLNEERKKNEAKWREELTERQKFQATFRYKYIYRYYNNIIKFCFRKINKFFLFMASNIWKIENKLTI